MNTQLDPEMWVEPTPARPRNEIGIFVFKAMIDRWLGRSVGILPVYMHWIPSLFQHNVPLGFNLRTKDRLRFIIGPKEICSLDAHFFGVPRAHPGRSPADLFWPVVAFHFLLD